MSNFRGINPLATPLLVGVSGMFPQWCG